MCGAEHEGFAVLGWTQGHASQAHLILVDGLPVRAAFRQAQELQLAIARDGDDLRCLTRFVGQHDRLPHAAFIITKRPGLKRSVRSRGRPLAAVAAVIAVSVSAAIIVGRSQAQVVPCPASVGEEALIPIVAKGATPIGRRPEGNGCRYEIEHASHGVGRVSHGMGAAHVIDGENALGSCGKERWRRPAVRRHTCGGVGVRRADLVSPPERRG